MSTKPNGKSILSSASEKEQPVKATEKSYASSDNDDRIMLFSDVTLGPHESELRFRLIHFWEARIPVKKTLIGLEMLLMDEQGSVIQGFVSPGRIKKYMPHLKRGTVYSLLNFYGSKNKVLYRVAAHDVTVSFAHNSVLSVLENSPVSFENDRFRFYSYEDFEAACDMQGDLYDVIGHMKLVNGQTLNERGSIDEAELTTTRRLLVHVQTYDGPVMKLYLWDDAATEFCKKFNSSESTPTVLLVTTVNTKRLGGTLALSSMSSSRVFMDNEVQPTKDYIAWLGTNPEIANQINAEVVTKPETLTIGDIFAYIKQDSAKDAFFECTATIDDVVFGSAWYYIGCGGCKTKATKGPSSLMCAKCGKNDVVGEAQYLAKISVYDKSEEAVFVLLGDAGRELTGKHASELVRSYFEVNGDKRADFQVPVPDALTSTIGQTYKFIVKVSDHNLTGKTRALTVTKVLALDPPASTGVSAENPITIPSEENLVHAVGVNQSSKSCHDSSEEGVKRTSDGVELEYAKRPKQGN